ncbi:MAG: ubiquinol-cytochrome c reductase iron-sulfur subunit [FCB group bacterium]|nr:ubiquinol-cytochrome c reductase iron-sulfur subunit [FCB group bacterium]
MDNQKKMTRREWMAAVFSGVALTAGYGVLAGEGLLFLLPEGGAPKTRKIFAGQISKYRLGAVQTFYDLQGNQIMVRRSESGFEAFSSTCPHLGCKVNWEEENNRFFCPCHRGIFDADGLGIAGPPGDAGQRLATVPVEVDEAGGVVYLEVKDVKVRGGKG